MGTPVEEGSLHRPWAETVMISSSFPGLPTDSVRASNSPTYWLPTPLLTGFRLCSLSPPYTPGTPKGVPRPFRATPSSGPKNRKDDE